MNKILQATYFNGNLILDERLDAALEGKKLTLILVAEPNSTTQGKPSLEARKQEFLDWVQNYQAKLPPDYKFDREEAHER